MPDERTVDVGGVRIVVRVWSVRAERRPPVMLLPGTGETARDWDTVAAALARPVYAVNLRGHGPSDWPGRYAIRLLADDVIGLLEHLGEPVDLVGHSLGGLVACAVAARRPALVRRLVLEDVALLRPRPKATPPRPTGAPSFDWRVVEQVRPEIDDPDPGWADVLATIPAPTLVVAGGPRSPVPQEHVADLVRALPDARMVTLDTGHLVHATMPAAFTGHLLTFLGVD